MKTWLWVVLMTSTAVLAMTLVWIFSIRESSGSPTAVLQKTYFELPGKNEPWPKVVVDTSEYDFGTMDTHQKHEYSFVIQNQGDAPLKLKVGDTTCKCTIGRLLRDEIAPGKSAKIHLQWETLGPTKNFRQTAEILTNDPDRPRFGLVITGKVQFFLEMVPKILVVSDATTHEPITRITNLYSQAVEHFEVTKIETTSDYLSHEVLPADKQTLKNQRAKSGYRVAVTVNPGFPLGRFTERVTIHTDIQDAKPLELIVKGIVRGDVSIYGSTWNDEMAYLKIGSVPRNQGATSEVHLYAQGPYRDLRPEDFTIQKTPDFLKVRITRDTELIGPAAPAHFIVVIEVPPNAPPVNHLGSEGAPLGVVRLIPNLPEDSKAVAVKLGVQFNVQQ